MPALHPLLRALRTTDLRAPSADDVNRIFDAAEKGGVTPTEAAALPQKSSTWSAAAKDAFDVRVANLDLGGTPVAPTDTDAAEAEDLSSNMETVWMQGWDGDTQAAYVADMARLGKELGYKVVLQLGPYDSVHTVASKLMELNGWSYAEVNAHVDVVATARPLSVWAEDNRIVTNAADITARVRVKTPPRVSEWSLFAAEAMTAGDGYHPFEPGSFQGAVSQRDEGVDAELLAARLGRATDRMRTYLEGGNVCPGTLPNGEPYALVGKDSLAISTMHLSETRAFSNAALQAKAQEMIDDGTLNNDTVYEAAIGVYRRKAWAGEPVDGYITQDMWTEAAWYLVERELTKGVIADDLGIPVENVVFTTQPEFHIDMHMRPLRPGEVMVNHPRANIALIDEALADPNLKSWEASELYQMRAHAQKDLDERGPVYDQIMAELEEAGLFAIPSPGVFKSNNRQANFLNAVPGTTDGGTSVYIAGGSSIQPLQRAFGRFVKDLGVERVEFVANQGGGQYSLSASETSLELAGSLDCRETDHAGRDVVDDLLDNVNAWVS